MVVTTARDFAQVTGKGHVRVDAQVRPRSTAFSVMTMEGGGSFVRIDRP